MKVKGVIHMHSTHSYDGKMSLLQLKDFLIQQDISFCCMTEHTDKMSHKGAQDFVEECRLLSDDTFIFIPGFEVPYKNAHVLHIGATQFVSQFSDKQQLFAWRKNAEFVVLAHPVRNKFVVDETLLDCIDGVEIWNQQYEGKQFPRVKSVNLLTKLRHKKNLLATGGLDFHRKEHFGSPITSLDLEKFSEENILKCLKNGAYTFGTSLVKIKGNENWKSTFVQKLQSLIAIYIINSGKLVNKVLFNLGLSLPSGLKHAIRSKV